MLELSSSQSASSVCTVCLYVQPKLFTFRSHTIYPLADHPNCAAEISAFWNIS